MEFMENSGGITLPAAVSLAPFFFLFLFLFVKLLDNLWQAPAPTVFTSSALDPRGRTVFVSVMHMCKICCAKGQKYIFITTMKLHCRKDM